MRHLYIVILLFITIGLKAQTPGYMGKKMYVGYQLNTSPISNIIRLILDGSKINQKPILYLRSRHQLEVSYAIGKRWVLGTSFSSFKKNKKLYYDMVRHYYLDDSRYGFYSSLSDNSYTVDYNEVKGIYSYNHDLNYYRAAAKSVRLKTRAIGFSGKYFTGNGIAPLGRYIKFEFLFNNVKAYQADQFDSEGNIISYSETPVVEKSVMVPSFILGYGRNKIINQYLMLSYGFDFGLTFTSKHHGYADLLSGKYYAPHELEEIISEEEDPEKIEEELIKIDISRVLLNYYAFKFTFGLTFLAK